MEIALAIATLIGGAAVIWAFIRWLWNRGKPPPGTKADTDAGEVSASVAKSGGVAATKRAAAMKASGSGLNVIAYPDAAVNISVNTYSGDLEEAPAPTRDGVREGQALQGADHHSDAIGKFLAAHQTANTDKQRATCLLLIGISQLAMGRAPDAEGSFREAERLYGSPEDEPK